jgi:hypothetical protein
VASPSALSVLRRVTGFLVTGFLLTGLLAVAASTPMQAEPGPCRPDQNGGLICAEGPGAARIIDGTISPSRRLAFAWRSPDRPPTEEAEEGKVESLLIRLSDGADLWRTEGLYWNTGTMHANKYNEDAAWSPNSRFAVLTTDVRWWTHTLRLFAIGANEEILESISRPSSSRPCASMSRLTSRTVTLRFSAPPTANVRTSPLTITA